MKKYKVYGCDRDFYGLPPPFIGGLFWFLHIDIESPRARGKEGDVTCILDLSMTRVYRRLSSCSLWLFSMAMAISRVIHDSKDVEWMTWHQSVRLYRSDVGPCMDRALQGFD